jgi:hypothetical protein
LVTFVVLLATCELVVAWPTPQRSTNAPVNDTCCILSKLNINSSRANAGRSFFAEMIHKNDSFQKINEDSVCSLMHFFMQEAALNGRPITFSKGTLLLTVPSGHVSSLVV